jgi:hypothetical protein
MSAVRQSGRELEQIVRETPARLRAFNEAQSAQSYRPGGWSRKQILGHLIDSAANNHHRFVRALTENPLIMPAYRQEEWVGANQYDQREWASLIEFWTAYNSHLCTFFGNLPPEAATHLCAIGNAQPVTLEFLMVDYVDHLKHHLTQILD